jgi:hypothetical protein
MMKTKKDDDLDAVFRIRICIGSAFDWLPRSGLKNDNQPKLKEKTEPKEGKFILKSYPSG